MSSTAYSMPSCSATDLPRVRLFGDESCSGSMRPKTLDAPRARTASAAHTALSTPPEIATIAPRRRSSVPTIPTRRFAIRSVSAAGSIVRMPACNRIASASGPAAAFNSGHRSRGPLARDVSLDVAQAVEVLRQHLRVLPRHAEGLFHEGDQLDEARGIQDVLVHERR